MVCNENSSDNQNVGPGYSEEMEVLSRYEEMQQAMVDKDIDTLNKIVKDGTMYTHMSGKRQTKEEYFSDIKNGRLDYQDYT